MSSNDVYNLQQKIPEFEQRILRGILWIFSESVPDSFKKKKRPIHLTFLDLSTALGQMSHLIT
jgi:hypothetical protein